MADEYICKQAAIDALPKPQICEYMDEFGAGRNSCAYDAEKAIKEVPAADVVPVVRCKDCKFRENDDFCTGRGFPYQLVPDGGFCDKGERAEE